MNPEAQAELWARYIRETRIRRAEPTVGDDSRTTAGLWLGVLLFGVLLTATTKRRRHHG
jgi:LPXTG-motif cell wall-anchored protein